MYENKQVKSCILYLLNVQLFIAYFSLFFAFHIANFGYLISTKFYYSSLHYMVTVTIEKSRKATFHPRGFNPLNKH